MKGRISKVIEKLKKEGRIETLTFEETWDIDVKIAKGVQKSMGRYCSYCGKLSCNGNCN